MVAAISIEWTCGIWPSREAYGLMFESKNKRKRSLYPSNLPLLHLLSLPIPPFIRIWISFPESKKKGSGEKSARTPCPFCYFLLSTRFKARAFFSFSILIIFFLFQGFSASFASPPLPLGLLIFCMAHFLRWWQIKGGKSQWKLDESSRGGIK